MRWKWVQPTELGTSGVTCLGWTGTAHIILAPSHRFHMGQSTFGLRGHFCAFGAAIATPPPHFRTSLGQSLMPYTVQCIVWSVMLMTAAEPLRFLLPVDWQEAREIIQPISLQQIQPISLPTTSRPLATSLTDCCNLQDCLEIGRIAKVKAILSLLSSYPLCTLHLLIIIAPSSLCSTSGH